MLVLVIVLVFEFVFGFVFVFVFDFVIGLGLRADVCVCMWGAWLSRKVCNSATSVHPYKRCINPNTATPSLSPANANTSTN